MSSLIKIKRSAVQGKSPNTSIIELGELALNTYDGKLYFKKDDGAESIVTIQEVTENNLAINTSTIDNSTANNLSGVIADFDSILTAATGGELSVFADATINGNGTAGDPLSVANGGHTHSSSNITDFNSSVTSIIGTTVNKTFVDALNVDADTLDGANSSYYLDYVNFTNKPTIGDATVTFTGDSVIEATGSFSVNDTVNSSIALTVNTAAISITESQISDLQDYLTSETTTSLGINANILTYTDETGANTDIDLSLYLDDTNLARLTSGTVAANGIATFERDDASTFNVDFSSLFDDTNLARITSASFSTSNGDLTLTRDDATTLNVNLDGRYLTSETDSQTLTWTSANTTLSISNGNDVNLSSLLDDTNTTYDLVSPGPGVLRLSDSANANDDITFIGSGGTTVSSNASHITIGSTDVTLDGLYDYLTLVGQTITLNQIDYNTDISNTPIIPSSGVDFDPVGTDNSTDVTLSGPYAYLTIVGQNITLSQVDATTDISGLATVATSGAYSDLIGAPIIGDATVTFTGDSVVEVSGSFSVNDTANSTIALTVNTAAISVTESQISDFGDYVSTSLLGANSGVAQLDTNGKVPTFQLPSYVDDVLEYANLASFPGTGESGKIYIDLAESDVYRWTGSTYIIISDAVSSADQATKLSTARTISLSGDATGSATFDGTANATISATVLSSNNSTNLNGQAASYYLDYNNFTNTPTLYTTANANTDIDARVTKSFVDGLNVDADTLDGANGTFYLDYTNFTNTPSIPTSGSDFDPVGTDNSTDVTLTGAYDYLTISGQQITLTQVDATTDISGLATVATSGAYSDLSGTPTNVSSFTNDAGYITGYTETDTLDSVTGRGATTTNSITVGDINANTITATLNGTANNATNLAGQASSYYLDYTNFTNTPTNVSDFTNDAGYITSYVDTNTTYDIVSPGSGVIRLSDNSNVNTDIIVVGSGDTTVTSNSTHLIVSSESSSVTNSNTAPIAPNVGDLWFNTNDGTLSVYYDDGNTTQWVVTSGVAGSDGVDGTDGNDGLGFTGGSYNPSTGIITFSSDDGLGFTTGDLRAPDYIAGNNIVISSNTISVNSTPEFSYTDYTPTDPGPAHSEGRVYYNDEYKALTYYNDISGVSLQVGLEEWVRVYNNTANTITNGTPVYATGSFGETLTIAPADATVEDHAQVVGLATHDIPASSSGVVTTRGLVSGINTSTLTEGGKFHLGPTGGYQTAAPTYPYFPVDIGWCVVSDATNGYIYVSIENHTFEQFRITGNQHIDGDLQIDGDLVVTGTQSVVSQASLNIDDSFVYLNSGDTIGLDNTNFSGTGLNDAYFNNHYEGTTTKTFYVRIDGVGTGTGGVDTFEWSLDNFSTTEATGVDLADEVLLSDNICIHFNALTGHTSGDTWSGTAAPLNVDSGWFSNRNTGATGVGYTHMGIFFDVSDNKFKVVDVYDPEPSGTIDTGDASFNLGTFVADSFEGDLTGNVTGNVTGNATTATSSLSANNATNLNGQDSEYYLNYNNFINTPTITNNYVTGLSFNTTNGVLTASRSGLSSLTVDLDGRYLTSYSESDTLDSVTDRGSSTTNELTVGGLSFDGTVKLDANGLTTLATSQVTLTQFATSTYSGGKFVINAKRGTDVHMTELMVVHNGTTASASEYGTVMTGSSLFGVDVDISSGNFRIRITPTSATSTLFNVSETLFLV